MNRPGLLAWFFCIAFPAWVWSDLVGLDFSLSLLTVAVVLLAVLSVAADKVFSLANPRVASKGAALFSIFAIMWCGASVVVGVLSGLPASAASIATNYWFSASPFILFLLGLVWGRKHASPRPALFALSWLFIVNAGAMILQYALLSSGRITLDLFWRLPKFDSIGFFGAVRIPGVFNNAGDSGLFISVFTSLTLFWAFTSRRRFWVRVLAVMILLVGGFLVYLTLTRKAFLTFSASTFLSLVLLTAKNAPDTVRRSYLSLAAIFVSVGVSVGLIGIALNFDVPTAGDSLISPESLNSRLYYWRGYADYFADHPAYLIVGTGQLQSARHYVANSSITLVDNMYLSLILFGGLPFLLMCVGGLLYSIRRLLRRFFRVKQHAWLMGASSVACMSILIYGSFATTWSNLSTFLPTVILLSLAYSTTTPDGGQT